MKPRLALIAVIGLMVAVRPVGAHHSFSAEYDSRKPVTLRGVVTKIEWTNPHSHCHLDVKDGSGAVTNWNLELASPRVLVQCGWRANSLKVGDEVTIEAYMAKDGSTRANARLVTLANGRLMSAGSSGGDLPQQ